MYSWIILGVTILLLGFLAWRKPFWLVPLLAIAVALEISITWYPELGIVNKAIGTLSLARLVSFALIFAGWGRLLLSSKTRERFVQVIKHPLTLVLLLFIVIGGVSTVYSAAPDRTIVETIRLLVLFFVFISITLVSEKKEALLPLQAVHFTALALAPLAFYEGITGNLIWQAEKLMRDEVLRVNATFIDPNIFARFIVLGIIANLILQLFARDRRVKLTYFAFLPILLAELILTSSRGGILTLGVILIAALILFPNKKLVFWIIGLGTLAGIIVLVAAPEIWDRLMVLTTNLEETQPERFYLWKAGIEMFKDHPVIGYGLGTFQHVFVNDYIHLRTVWEGVTISHTTILTIAAELGVIGLVVVAFLWLVLLGVLFQLHGRSDRDMQIFRNSFNEFYAGTGYFLWILAIFISSQAEGRFFEDPMFWLSSAFMIALSFNKHVKHYY